jgi:hypothetical protein
MAERRASLKPEAEHEAEVTRRKVLAAEAVALLLLRRKSRVQLRDDPRPEALEFSLSALLLDIRRRARVLGIRRLRAELAREVAMAPASSIAYDQARARMGARGYSRAVYSYAHKAAQAGEVDSFRAAVDLGARRAAYKLETAAATETFEAFNHERDKAARQLAAEQGVQLWKVWDAVLDKRTCGYCERLHGVAVPASDDFPEGRPGAIHPRCRCVETILTLDQIDFGRNF